MFYISKPDSSLSRVEPVFAMKDQDVSDVIKTKYRTAMKYIGIDVSKATFVVAYSPDKGGEIHTFDNTTAGIRQFIGTLPKEDGSIHCAMEATGNYSALLLYLLNVAGITVSIKNPLKVSNFARAVLSTVKTDKSVFQGTGRGHPAAPTEKDRHTSTLQADYRHVEPSRFSRMSARSGQRGNPYRR